MTCTTCTRTADADHLLYTPSQKAVVLEDEGRRDGGVEEARRQRDAKILEEWKTHPGLGPSQSRNQLRRKGVKVSVHCEAVRPNHLSHMDFVQRFIRRVSTFTLIVIDDCARYVVGHGVDEAERAPSSPPSSSSRSGRAPPITDLVPTAGIRPAPGVRPGTRSRRQALERGLYRALVMSARMRVVSSTHRSRARLSFHLSS